MSFGGRARGAPPPRAPFSLRPRSPPVAPTPLALAVAHSACSMHQSTCGVFAGTTLVLYLAWSLLCLSPYLNSAWQVFSLTRSPMHLIVLLASMRTVTGHLARDATAPESWSSPPPPPPPHRRRRHPHAILLTAARSTVPDFSSMQTVAGRASATVDRIDEEIEQPEGGSQTRLGSSRDMFRERTSSRATATRSFDTT